MKAVHAFAPSQDTADTPLVLTTGTDSLPGGCRRMKFVDILTLKERFDNAGIPLEDRYIVLHPQHVTDLLVEDINLFKDITNLRDGEPMKFGGFGFFQFPHMPLYRQTDGVLTKLPYGVVPEATDRFASIAFYSKEVMKADGEIYMYATVDDPKERATIVGFDKRFIALPIRGKGIGAIVSNSNI